MVADASDYGDPHRHNQHDHSVSDHQVVLTRVHAPAPVVVYSAIAAGPVLAVPASAAIRIERIEAPPPRRTCHSAFSLRGPPTA
jgi:hypothetical protein